MQTFRIKKVLLISRVGFLIRYSTAIRSILSGSAVALFFLANSVLGQTVGTCFATISVERPHATSSSGSQPGNSSGGSSSGGSSSRNEGSSGNSHSAGKQHPNVHGGFWSGFKPDDGYEWVSEDKNDLRVRLAVDGTASSQHPHTIWDGKGKLYAEDGYEWVSGAPDEFQVRRVKAGTPSTRYPHVFWMGEGRLIPAAGYHWVSKNPAAEGDYRVEFIAGTPHPGLPARLTSQVVHIRMSFMSSREELVPHPAITGSPTILG